MDDLSSYAGRPFAFVGRYLLARWRAHAIIAVSVAAAVMCAVGTQYGVKILVDSLASGPASSVWLTFLVMAALIAADNLLWRAAGWVTSTTFVNVTGDLRRDLFRHITGHAPSYFAGQLPGMLTGRITATSNAVYTIENMIVFNIMPPCLATIVAINLVATVSVAMATVLSTLGGLIVVAMFYMAAAGQPLHHDFAAKAAAVDGEMVDVVSNISLVKTFCSAHREIERIGEKVDCEMVARSRSLRYLERLRVGHAVTTVAVAIGLVGWAVTLWQQGRATAGDVVLTATLGLSVLHATRDLAVALVDATQHFARLSEALVVLLAGHQLRDHPEAGPLAKRGASIKFENVRFGYQDERRVFQDFNLRIDSDQRVGIVGESGSGKSTLFALLQRFYDLQGGRILIEGQDIARVTQDSLRTAIAVVPQDISLFHRSIMENIRYGRPDASDREVLRAAGAAGCEFIQDLPGGFDMIVGDRGAKLSGGERQRIAIARAFLKNSPILLLDEATASLDGDLEEAVRAALTRLMQRRTVIAIAHRLSTLRNFDRVIVLKSGRVVDDGAPDQLMRRKGPYYELMCREMDRLKEQLV